MLRRHKQGIALALGIVLFLVTGVLLATPSAPKYHEYASLSSDPAGVLGIYRLLQQDHANVRSWRESPSLLPPGKNQVLLVAEPEHLTALDRQFFRDWAAKGNHLLLFMQHPDGFDSFQTIRVGMKPGTQPGTQPGQDIKPETLSAPKVEASPSTGGLSRSYQGLVYTDSRLRAAKHARVILKDSRGIVAERVPAGDGDMTVFVTPEWLSNQFILKYNHFEMIWPQLSRPAAAIWFDDYHHGLARKAGLGALYPRWLIVSAVQAALVLLLWLWWKGKRFGPVYTPREWVVRRSDETLQAVAGWYLRTKSAREAVLHQENDLRQRLFEKWGIPFAASPESIRSTAANKWNADRAGALMEALRKCGNIRERGHCTVQQMMRLNREMEHLNQWLKRE